MRRKVVNIHFMPDAVNFSDLEPYQVDELGSEEEENVFIESQICQMVYSLKSDKERCVLLYQLLREDGFNFDHESAAKSLHINWRWYMRVKEQVRKKLERFKLAAS